MARKKIVRPEIPMENTPTVQEQIQPAAPQPQQTNETHHEPVQSETPARRKRKIVRTHDTAVATEENEPDIKKRKLDQEEHAESVTEQHTEPISPVVKIPDPIEPVKSEETKTKSPDIRIPRKKKSETPVQVKSDKSDWSDKHDKHDKHEKKKHDKHDKHEKKRDRRDDDRRDDDRRDDRRSEDRRERSKYDDRKYDKHDRDRKYEKEDRKYDKYDDKKYDKYDDRDRKHDKHKYDRHEKDRHEKSRHKHRSPSRRPSSPSAVHLSSITRRSSQESIQVNTPSLEEIGVFDQNKTFLPLYNQMQEKREPSPLPILHYDDPVQSKVSDFVTQLLTRDYLSGKIKKSEYQDLNEKITQKISTKETLESLQKPKTQKKIAKFVEQYLESIRTCKR